ncbi:serine/threonine-protein kinase Nek10-like [Kryptolebias marmoratus]|uniref:serine/threonine-protein kinase Nek10-like n=1 Tax=Kryptolebias marmoratus TaxID=37003 RepID=UPI0018ACA682|nr:serine/threonine-protein kinase Nek10-like [Kryptolebias marmoratus]
MSDSVKNVKPEEKLPLKSRRIQSRASYDLRRLQSLLATSSSRQEVSTLSHSRASSSRAGTFAPKRSGNDISAEASELEKFSTTYKDYRCFSNHPLRKLFLDVLTSLVKNRLCSEWIDHAPPEAALRILTCLRLLVRDPNHQARAGKIQIF